MTIITYPWCNFQHGAYIEEFDTLSCDLVHSCSNPETESASDNNLCLSVVKAEKLRVGKGFQISFFLKGIFFAFVFVYRHIVTPPSFKIPIIYIMDVCSAYSI